MLGNKDAQFNHDVRDIASLVVLKEQLDKQPFAKSGR